MRGDNEDNDESHDFIGWKRNTALFLTSQGVSIFGSMLVNYAIFWHVTLKTQSGSVMTLFAIATAVPMFLISPFGGVWADRYNRKYLISISDGCIAAITLLMAAAFSFGLDSTILLFACAVARSFGQGIQTPTVSALLPQLVPKEHLTRVNGINSAIMSMSMLATPMLSGAIMTFAPIQSVLFVDVATAAIGISILFFLVKVPVKPKSIEEGQPAKGYFTDIGEGFRYIGGHPFIKRFFIVSALFYVLSSPAELLTPLQVVRDFGEDFWRLTAVEVSFSAGMILGGLIMSIWGGFKNRTYCLALAMALLGVETIMLGLLENFWLYLSCMAAIGVTVPLFITPMTTIFQTRVDEEYMGRVFSVTTMISCLMSPLGMAFFGPLSDLIKIDYILIATGSAVMLTSLPMALNKEMVRAGAAEETATHAAKPQ